MLVKPHLTFQLHSDCVSLDSIVALFCILMSVLCSCATDILQVLSITKLPLAGWKFDVRLESVFVSAHPFNRPAVKV